MKNENELQNKVVAHSRLAGFLSRSYCSTWPPTHHNIQIIKQIFWKEKKKNSKNFTFFLFGADTLDLIWVRVFSRNFESSGDCVIFSGLFIPKWCFLQS